MGCSGVLGCGTPSVFVADRCGSRNLYEITDFSELAWPRVIDEASEATVRVTLAGNTDAACCAGLAATRSWAHSLVVLRDGERVWEGPIVNIAMNRDEALLTARDVTAWLDVRTTHDEIDITLDTDLADIATRVITSALAPDDPCILQYLEVVPTGTLSTLTLDPNMEVAGDVLRELARSGLDYTAVGRMILLGPDIGGIYPGGGAPFVHLLDEHFAGGLEIGEAGLEAATRWIVQGDGVTGIDGGIDPFYGLIERIAKEDGIAQQLQVNGAATSRVEATNPPPLYVDSGAQAGLVPTAPVCIGDLIPGRLVHVTARDTCREVNQLLRLVAVNVSYTPADGEAVGITLAPVGTLTTQTQPTR